MVNSVTLIGRMGRDPEVRRLESGVSVAKIAVATTERYKDANGEQQERTEWHNIFAWRGLAEVMEKYYKKGYLVYIEGKLTHRKYTTAEGVDKYITEVVANTAKIVSRPGEGGGSSGYFPTEEPISQKVTAPVNTVPATPAPAPAPATPDAPAAEEGGDLPF